MKLYVMTGQIQTGKTTWLKAFLNKASDENMRIDGLITPAIFENGQKTGIEAYLLPEKEKFLLAKKRFIDSEIAHKNDQAVCEKDKKLGYEFSGQSIERINAHLHYCVGAQNLVIDEIGPLEMMQGKGYTEALKLLDESAVTNAIVVIRPSLLNAAAKRWGEFEILTPKSSIDDLMIQL